MNIIQHLLTCIAEEGAEVTQCATKSLRFGLADVNILNPKGPTNQQRLIQELNDVEAVADMLVEYGVLPSDWRSDAMQSRKREKVLAFMRYAQRVGALSESTSPSNEVDSTESKP